MRVNRFARGAAFTAFVLAAPLSSPSWAQAPQAGLTSLEGVLVESANTPAEHQALANYFRGKAEQDRQSAAEHRAMSKNYAGSLKQTQIAQQKTHCEKLATLYEQSAAQYEEMAKVHEAAAKGQ